MRLFVAVSLPDSIKADLIPLCMGLPGARWVNSDQMHITLRFLGELEGALAYDLVGALTEVRAPQFDLSLSGIGYFGNSSRLRVLWAGIERSLALEHLQAKIERVARRSGLLLESRRFQPHVTLARFNGSQPNLSNYLSHHEPFQTERFSVYDFVLFSSHLGTKGASYRVEKSYALEAPF